MSWYYSTCRGCFRSGSAQGSGQARRPARRHRGEVTCRWQILPHSDTQEWHEGMYACMYVRMNIFVVLYFLRFFVKNVCIAYTCTHHVQAHAHTRTVYIYTHTYTCTHTQAYCTNTHTYSDAHPWTHRSAYSQHQLCLHMQHHAATVLIVHA